MSEQKNYTFVTDTGDAMDGATVYVYEAGTTTEASITDVDGAAITQPMTADSTGSVTFRAGWGEYDVVATLSGDTVTLYSEFFSGVTEDGGDIASATTMTVPATGGMYANITGTTSIEGITSDRPVLLLHFTSALTLVDSATFDVGGSNLAITAGQIVMFVKDDTEWRGRVIS